MPRKSKQIPEKIRYSNRCFIALAFVQSAPVFHPKRFACGYAFTRIDTHRFVPICIGLFPFVKTGSHTDGVPSRFRAKIGIFPVFSPIDRPFSRGKGTKKNTVFYRFELPKVLPLFPVFPFPVFPG